MDAFHSPSITKNPNIVMMSPTTMIMIPLVTMKMITFLSTTVRLRIVMSRQSMTGLNPPTPLIGIDCWERRTHALG